VALVSPVSQTSQFCGGTLISNRHVLTAAHCTEYAREEYGHLGGQPFDVVVAEHTISDTSDGIVHQICDYFDHPEYNRYTLRNDFSIVTLSVPVQLGPRAVPACLPTSSMNEAFLNGKKLTVSGWGDQTGSGDYANDLRVLDVPAVANDVCSRKWWWEGRLTEDMLCTESGSKGACYADSGGPLTYNNGGRATVVGAVSFGKGGCPGVTVYARVTEVLPWIQGEMNKQC